MAHPHQNDNAVASSSSARSTSTSYGPYDVFINHRGPDTKKTFAARLYDRLKSHGLQVFLDERELEPGYEFPAQIEAAIEVASVHVAVFSTTYRESEWCLKELLLMEKSRGIILPVYYNVEPSDLRHGAYLDYLKQKQRDDPQTLQKKPRYDPQTLQNWAEALKRSADLTGFPLSAYNGDEVELLEKLVQEVEKTVRKKQFNVSEHPTGLAAKFKDFERRLLSREKEACEARVVGIWGGGGLGKTTLAQEIFNRTRLEYSGAALLFDVKVSSDSLHSLQTELIKRLRHRVVKIDSWRRGTEILQDCLTDYHALIILDDVDNVDQLLAFLPIKRVLDPRSLILVTSRDKQALLSAKIADTSIYQLTGLDDPDSKKLFCLHAFSQPYPEQGFETLVNGFLTVCKGLPLSLTVVGRVLWKKNIVYWDAQLKGLHHLPREINTCLQISYKSLTDMDQQIFLDIACFSIGKDKDTWIRIWAESGWNGVVGFQNLIDKGLVEVDGENNIRMHDHVRDLGRSISLSSQSGPRRLWSATMRDVVHHLLEQSSNVRGIRMAPGSSSRDTSEMSFNRTSSQYTCSELRLFEAEGDFVNTILTRVKLPNLIWLSWTECRCSSLPSCIPTESLKVLEVTGRKLENLWQSDRKVPRLLQELNINAPLKEFPKSLRQLEKLEKIFVECSMDEEAHLATLPEELADLCFLKYLMLKGCSKLRNIPESIGRLINLQQINLSGCKKLEGLPCSLGCLTNIQNIDLSACESLTMLPASLENLSNLLHINLSKCKCLGMDLGMLPISVGNFVNLQRIELSGCISLEGLPDSFVDLATLQYVDLSQCEFLGSLPDSSGNLKNIQHIDLSGCKSLQKLPDSWVNSTSLQRIDLSGCRRLERLPDTLGNLTNLHYINLCECENLKKLPEFNPNFTNIQDLNLYGCKSLKMLPESIKNLTNLRRIDLSECTSLGSLPESFGIPESFGMLTELQHIDFRRCSSLKKLPGSFGDLKSLQHLDLQGCSSLKELPDSFGRLTDLIHINLSSCKSLETLPHSFGNLLQLKHLDLTDCCTLTISIERPLETVARLYLGTNIKQLPEDVVCLSQLELLHLEGPLLESLPPRLDQLRGLKELYLIECTKLQYLSDSVGLLIQLNKLEIRDCAIQNLPQALLELNKLEHLEVRKCPLGQLPFSYVGGESETELLTEGQRASSSKGMLNLEVLHLEALEISEISFPRGVCPRLHHLRIRDCMQIAEVGALPTTLTTLDLRRCGALRNIGGLCFVAALRNLDMRGCYNINLEELPEPLLEALVISLKVFRPPLDTHDGQDEALRGLEILISILRARRRWCSSCTEGVLPFLRRWERLEIL